MRESEGGGFRGAHLGEDLLRQIGALEERDGLLAADAAVLVQIRAAEVGLEGLHPRHLRCQEGDHAGWVDLPRREEEISWGACRGGRREHEPLLPVGVARAVVGFLRVSRR